MGIIKEVLFNDGEGLTYGDLTNIQRFASAKLQDVLLHKLATRGANGTPETDSVYCWAFGDGAFPYCSATPMVVTNNVGTLCHVKDVTVTGSSPKMLIYHVATDELLTTVNAAHATLNRIDSIFLSLSESNGDSESRDFKDAVTGALSTTPLNKKYNVSCTKSYVPGTGTSLAATPVPMAAPSGYMRWCDIYVPAVAASLTPGNLRDQRFPLGHQTVHCHSHAASHWRTLGGWAINGDGVWGANALNDVLECSLTPASAYQHGRVTSVFLYANLGAAAEVQLVRREWDSYTDTVVGDYSASVLAQLGGGSGLAILAVTSSSVPVWANGFSAGPASYHEGIAAAGVSSTLYLKIKADSIADRVRFARWEIQAQ